MTSRELQEKVWELIDEHSMELSKEEYLDFLQGIRDDADMRAKTMEKEIDD